MNNETVIDIRNLYKTFGANQVLKDVNLTIKKGESLVLIGGSGTGKSVLIKNIMGIITPDSGDIFINGVNTSKITQYQRLKSKFNIGMLFQGSALFDSLTVLENVIFFKTVHKKIAKKEEKELAVENLRLVGLDEAVLYKYPSEISGGMQKRVALARLIVQNPDIIFFDEPTTGLDPIMSEVINSLIIKITKYLGATSLIITHDMHSAKKIATKIAMIYQGNIIWQGLPTEVDNSSNAIVDSFIKGKIPIK